MIISIREGQVSGIGERLRKLRQAAQLTQQALSEASGLERDKIAKIETGTRRASGTDVVYLAEALGVAPQELVHQESPVAKYRGSGDLESPAGKAMERWFADYVDDSLFLDRALRRYGLE